MERLRAQIVAALKHCCSPAFIIERSDTDARVREGLVASDGVLYGVVPASVIVRENGLDFCANVSVGQKTGFFLDQRDNRKLFSHYAIDRKICDCFCYSAGFSIYGLAAGAKHSTAVDISKNAIDNAKTNIALHKISPAHYDCVVADVFEYLRKPDKKFDCIVLDPPKFAKHKGEVDKAARGYKDINLLACKSIDKGGIIFTFSCSQAIDAILFRQIVFAAAADSDRHVQVLHTLGAGPDHPFSIAHREGEYLKGLVLRVL
jgi:23S rRNA (cytosine1962-C5)-methyltransferase